MIKVADDSIEWHEGMTISDLLDKIEDTHPYAVVRINQTYVSRPNFDKTTIPDNAQVFLLSLIHI